MVIVTRVLVAHQSVDIDKKGTQGNRNVLCFECGVGYIGIYILSKNSSD